MTGKIMIVDDAAFMRAKLKNILTRAGYEVVGEAENGEAALEKFSDLKPDIVTMDITMPIMNGVEAVKNIVEIDKNAIIIMCSAMGQKEIIIEAIQAGARDFIVKPFQDEKVISTIENNMIRFKRSG